jgi:phosphatidylglycerophosphatase A
VSKIALALATCFGCGLFPWGPGTAGSLVAIGIAWLVSANLGGTRQFLFGMTCLLIMPAVWSATVTAKQAGNSDPGKVVIDELLGQWVTLLGAPVYTPVTLGIGFFLFRLFDIWKPWPVCLLEELPEGWGIVADDIGAGLLGALILYIGSILVPATRSSWH